MYSSRCIVLLYMLQSRNWQITGVSAVRTPLRATWKHFSLWRGTIHSGFICDNCECSVLCAQWWLWVLHQDIMVFYGLTVYSKVYTCMHANVNTLLVLWIVKKYLYSSTSQAWLTSHQCHVNYSPLKLFSVSWDWTLSGLQMQHRPDLICIIIKDDCDSQLAPEWWN